ncbi:MAG TPA: cytochrome c biogenesis protein CcsA [Candidatus Angelobacter sp.]|nr:cytochrome c biogenesis protein CcsA [Candidatus Angelobacter sp.]
MPLFWLRVALSLYGVGLLYAVLSLWGGRPILTRIMLPAVGLGTVFHFVAIVEYGMLGTAVAPSFLHQAESLLAFLLMAFFFVVYFKYKTASPGVAVFPMAFLLTVFASAPSSLLSSPSPGVSNRWIIIHVGLILVGYSALFFSFFASILYLIQERNLKAKATSGGFWSKLPALATIDEIGYKCLVFGFPFMTLGLIAGSIVAEARFGSSYFLDPKILLSILMWVVYMVLLYTRWSAGWRGRRAAYLAAFAFAAAVLAWSVNNGWHRFIAP